MAKFTGSLTQYPARATLTWFIGLIGTGSVLLWLPVSHSGRPGSAPIAWIDALFTATSAACVTGLAVRSTPDDFSFFGQCVILGLIQLGGIGIITITTFLTLRIGQRESLRHKAVVAQALGGADLDLRWVLRNVFRFVALVELSGAAVLFVRNLTLHPQRPWLANLWESFFHSISAFCNAGFGLYNDNLIRYQDDLPTNFAIMLLIITGGIGFPVVLDVLRNLLRPIPGGDPRRHRGLAGRLRLVCENLPRLTELLTLHSKLMLLGTSGLLLLGFGGILLLEWDGALAEMSLGRKLLVAAFQSVTPRTAGFQTIDMVVLSDATLFMLVILMMIGAGPCSTAGGFKVSTLAVLLANAGSKFAGRTRISLFRRTIAPETVASASATALIAGTVAALGLTAMLIFEPAAHYGAPTASERSFLATVFEVASALGTVGLSMNYSPTMSVLGKLIIVCLMFVGRLGPISVFIALARGQQRQIVEFPKEEVLIG